jgi:hypothetical protein
MNSYYKTLYEFSTMETLLGIFHQEIMTQDFVESTCSAVVLSLLIGRGA